MSLTISAQIISIISMVIMVLSFQMKRNKNLFAMQIVASIGFAVSYFMLGSPIGAMFNIGECLGACSSLFLNSKIIIGFFLFLNCIL